MLKSTIAGICLLAAASAWAGDWPAFRGPDASGIAAPMQVNKDWASKAPTELWRVPLTDQGYGGPAVADGKVFIVDHRGALDVVRALDLQTGKEIWRHTYPDMQKPNYGFSRATPAVVDGHVYTISMAGKVHCLDAEGGKVVWAVDMVKDLGGAMPGWGYAGSPVMDGDRVLVTPGKGATLAALDRNTGKLIWKSGDDQAGYSTPVVATINNVKQYILFSGTAVAGYRADDGGQLWSFPWKTSYDVNASVPVVIGNSVFISSGYGTGCALLDITPEGAKQRWRNKAIQQHFSSAILHDGMLYSTTDPGDLVCLDPQTGNERWRSGGFEKGGIAAVDGVILALGGKTGDLVMVKMSPEKYEELGRTKPLGGESWTAPVVAQGKVLVRNKTALACLSLE